MCAETAVEKVEPLSGLNMQLKRVHADACKTVDKGQRWSLFQTQCIIKGKECKYHMIRIKGMIPEFCPIFHSETTKVIILPITR